MSRPIEELLIKLVPVNEYDKNFPFGKPKSFDEIPPIKGKDDAQMAFYVPIARILDGRIPLAFAHAAHLLATYDELHRKYPKNELFEEYIDKLKLIVALSLHRNNRLMRKINARLTEINRTIPSNQEKKTLHTIEEIKEDDERLLISSCEQNKINHLTYFNEEYDEDEVQGCTNEFCLNQRDEPGHASDAVRIIIDSDCIHWIVLIVRNFAPGRGNLALAGGFLDSITELYSEAATRELDEEVGGLNWLTLSYSIKFDLPEQKIPGWDIRASFAKYGMIVGGNAIIYLLDRDNDYILKRNSHSECCIIA